MTWEKVKVKSSECPPVLWGHSMNVCFNGLLLNDRHLGIVFFYLEEQAWEEIDAICGCSTSVRSLNKFDLS